MAIFLMQYNKNWFRHLLSRSIPVVNHVLLKLLVTVTKYFRITNLATITIFMNPIFILTTAFIAFVMQMIFNISSWTNVQILEYRTDSEKPVITNPNILQSHPSCGVTSGGREECWWGCDKKTVDNFRFYLLVILQK